MRATASATRTHNPSGEVRRASCLRENLTSSSYGEGLETGRARVQVPRQPLTRQLLFKEMKSHYGMEGLPSRKGPIVETLLYATVVTLVVSRHLLRAVREALRSLGRLIPEGRWAAIFATVASEILNLLLAPLRAAREQARGLEAILLHEAVDPNLSRHLLLARVENGVI